jgi:hypothetical protein
MNIYLQLVQFVCLPPRMAACTRSWWVLLETTRAYESEISICSTESQITCVFFAFWPQFGKTLLLVYFMLCAPSHSEQLWLNKTEKSFSNIAASQFCYSRSNKSTTTLQFWLLRGCVIVALQGCVIVALQGCVIVALLLRCEVAWLSCCKVAWLLQGCKVAWLLHCKVAWLLRCKVSLLLRYNIAYCCVARLRDCCVEGCMIVVFQGCVIVLLRDCCVTRLRDCAMLILKISVT